MDPGVGMPDVGSEPRVGLAAPSAGTSVRGEGLRKDGVGAERGMSRTTLETVAVVSPFQGGANVGHFKLMIQPHPTWTFSSEAEICRSGFACLRGIMQVKKNVKFMYYLIYVKEDISSFDLLYSFRVALRKINSWEVCKW